MFVFVYLYVSVMCFICNGVCVYKEIFFDYGSCFKVDWIAQANEDMKKASKALKVNQSLKLIKRSRDKKSSRTPRILTLWTRE